MIPLMNGLGKFQQSEYGDGATAGQLVVQEESQKIQTMYIAE
jgi:hypothetical protein